MHWCKHLLASWGLSPRRESFLKISTDSQHLGFLPVFTIAKVQSSGVEAAWPFRFTPFLPTPAAAVEPRSCICRRAPCAPIRVPHSLQQHTSSDQAEGFPATRSSVCSPPPLWLAPPTLWWGTWVSQAPRRRRAVASWSLHSPSLMRILKKEKPVTSHFNHNHTRTDSKCSWVESVISTEEKLSELTAQRVSTGTYSYLQQHICLNNSLYYEELW